MIPVCYGKSFIKDVPYISKQTLVQQKLCALLGEKARYVQKKIARGKDLAGNKIEESLMRRRVVHSNVGGCGLKKCLVNS